MSVQSSQIEQDLKIISTKIVSIICAVLGGIAILIPLLYHVSPWSGVGFTAIAVISYILVTYFEARKLAAALLIGTLTAASLAFSVLHGVYGTLGFVLNLLCVIVGTLLWSPLLGVVVLTIQGCVEIPLAIQQSRSREVFDQTPMVPDIIMSLLLTLVILWMLFITHRKLLRLHTEQHRSVHQLSVFTNQFDTLVQERIARVEEDLSSKIRQLSTLATTGRQARQLKHDIANVLTQLRLTLDTEPTNAIAIEDCFSHIRELLQVESHKEVSGAGDINLAVTAAKSILLTRLRECSCTIRAAKTIHTTNLNQSDLNRIFIAIFTNSLDAMNRSSKNSISVSSKVVSGKLHVHIGDTGSGIDPDILEYVQKPWFSTKDSSHSGLGLSMVQELLDKVVGTLDIRSTKRRGTEVTLVLPCHV